MPWRLVFQNAARRQLRQLSERDRRAIGQALDVLETDPSRADLSKLGGRNEWRMRVGRWRVLLEMDNTNGSIVVLAIRARNEQTYR